MGPESNLWMAEDAYGYFRTDDLPGCSNIHHRKNILIVDDINDSGATMQWIKNDWQNSCMPTDPIWSEVWNHNVKFAVLVDNQSSEFKNIDYSGMKIDKSRDPRWIVFPWEEWWKG
jgi:hypoxanthine phosphoribosyltransferase